MPEKPLFTVAIPTYNRLECLKVAVECVLKQTYPNIQLVILNNASTDGTYEYLAALKQAHPEVIIIHNETNIGFAKNVQQIPDHVKGKYFSVYPDDDLMQEKFVAEAVADLEANPYHSLWYCSTKVISQDNRILSTIVSAFRQVNSKQAINHFFTRKLIPVFSSTVFRTDTFIKNNCFGCDSDFLDMPAVVQQLSLGACCYNNKSLMIAISTENTVSGRVNLSGWIDKAEECSCYLKKVLRRSFLWRKCILPVYIQSWHGTAYLYVYGRFKKNYTSLDLMKSLWKSFTYHPFSSFYYLLKYSPSIVKMTIAQFKTVFFPTSAVKNEYEISPEKFNDNNISEQQQKELCLNELIESILKLTTNSEDINLWGEPYLLRGGEIFTRFLIREFESDGYIGTKLHLPIEGITINDEDEKFVTGYLQEVLNSNWGRDIKKQALYHKAIAYRKKIRQGKIKYYRLFDIDKILGST